MLRLNQLHAGTQFRRLVRSLSIRPSWLLAPCADPTEVALSPLGRLGLLRPGFQFLGHPKKLPDITTAPHGDLRRRDLHPLVKQLASLRFLHRVLRGEFPCFSGTIKAL